MKIVFNGASGTVTGSSYIFQGSKRDLMIDFGMYQGPEEIIKHNFDDIDIDVDRLQAVLLTHAHLDHCGRLPILIKKGYKGPIYMTEATRVLAELVLYDSAKIAQTDDKVDPLYVEEDVSRLLAKSKILDYHEELQVGDYKVKFYDAGHILGSASIEIEIFGKKVLFSGDLGNTPQMIERPTELIDNADVVIMESTYGGRLHPAEDPLQIIREEINTIEATGGALLIPSFSIERTQALLLLIGILKRNKQVHPDTPVYIDSPMALSATDIYKEFQELYNKNLKSELNRYDPFSFSGLNETRTANQSRKIANKRGPKVIIAGSGMMTGGRILHHARKFLPRRDTRLLIVGYQGENTLGREILEGAGMVEIDGKMVNVRASIRETGAMSAHADHEQLIDWLASVNNVQKLFLTHGENDAREKLAKDIQKRLNISDTTMPELYSEHSF